MMSKTFASYAPARPPPQPVSFAPIHQLLPPPPPPLPVVPSTTQAPVFSCHPPLATAAAYPSILHPENMTGLDTSKPPPSQNTLTQNGTVKRQSTDIFAAGPCKARKVERPKMNIPCENCVHHAIRIDMYKNELKKMSNEEENISLMFKKKLEDYNSGKNMLKKLVSPELFLILEEYIEGEQRLSPQSQDVFLDQSAIIKAMLERTIRNSRGNWEPKLDIVNRNTEDRFFDIPPPTSTEIQRALSSFPTAVAPKNCSNAPTSAIAASAAVAPVFAQYRPDVPPPPYQPYYRNGLACHAPIPAGGGTMAMPPYHSTSWTPGQNYGHYNNSISQVPFYAPYQ